MKIKTWMGLASALCLGVFTTSAQEATSINQIQQLQEQLQRMQRQFEEQQRLFQQQTEALRQQLDSLKQQQTTATTEQNRLKQMMETKLSEAPAAVADPPWRPTDPIRLVNRGSAYLNISFDGLFAAGTSTARDMEALSPGGHDPNQRGFSVQNIELTLDGAVDPYFRGQANLVFPLTREGETVVELEEAFLETQSLPGNLQLKAGQFFTEFGRHNPTHPHSWAFVDMPLVNHRMFGGDGQRGPGARLSWLAPTPFYSELLLALQNGTGETAFSFRNEHEGEAAFGRGHAGLRADRALALRDLTFSPRYQASWDLTETHTLLAGASASFGANNSGSSAGSEIYGADLTWKWKPADHSKGFPFVTFQNEFMFRRYEAGAYTDDLDADGVPDLDLAGDGATILTVPNERIVDYGFYTQLLYGFRPGWVTGLRWDYVAPERALYEGIVGLDAARDRRWRLSPNLTWHPSEFSKVRLQYNYDARANIGPDHSVWLQFEFALGAHAAHKF